MSCVVEVLSFNFNPYQRCNLTLSMTICSRPLFVVLSYRWTTTKVLHICRTKDVSNFEYDNFVVLKVRQFCRTVRPRGTLLTWQKKYRVSQNRVS